MMSLDQISLPLFLPASRMDRFDKAARSGADAVILDLEDAVAPEAKAAAREALRDGLSGADGTRRELPVLVRVNGRQTPWHEADLARCRGLPLAAVVLPKSEDPGDCAAVADALGLPVVALVESAAGLHRAEAVAQASARLAFGSIDFAADLGIAHVRHALAQARAGLVLAARLAGQPAPWDGVTAQIDDAALVEDDSRYAVEMGFGGKLLIHPAQVGPARRGMTPDEAEVARARRIVAAASGSGEAIRLDGMMIDAPVVARARQVLGRAGKREA